MALLPTALIPSIAATSGNIGRVGLKRSPGAFFWSDERIL